MDPDRHLKVSMIVLALLISLGVFGGNRMAQAILRPNVA
jgi:hypothetical protein